MINHFVTNIANKVKDDQCLAITFKGYCNWCGKYGHKETECLVKKSGGGRAGPPHNGNKLGRYVYLPTPTMALAKAGAIMSDGEMEAVEAVTDVAVAKDCTAEMVADTVEVQTTMEMNAPRIKRSTPIHACWPPRMYLGT